MVSSETHAPTYRRRLLSRVRRYTPADVDALVTLRREMLGESSPLAQAEQVRWQYEQHPDTTARHTAWTYDDDGRIVGEQGALPTTLQIGSDLFSAAWAIHLFVTPRFQLRGIGAALSETCFEAHRLVLGLEVSSDAQRAFRRAGWHDVGAVPLWVRSLDVGHTLGEYLPKLPSRVAGALLDPPLSLVDALLSTRVERRGLQLQEVPRFGEGVDALWEQVRFAYPVVNRRTSRELNWRFADYPEAGRYRLLELKKRGHVVGYAVMRLPLEAPHEGHLVDFFCAPARLADLLVTCMAFCRSARVKHLYCLSTSAGLAATFRRLGFIRRDSGWPLMFRARDLGPAELSTLRDQGNWFLTAGDSDVDRPRNGTVYAPSPRWS